jgi:hypothetical protein
MTAEEDAFRVLVQNVDYLMDRQAILDVISLHARGCDRHGVGLIDSTYWPDGADEHGTSINPGSEYGTWASDAKGRE